MDLLHRVSGIEYDNQIFLNTGKKLHIYYPPQCVKNRHRKNILSHIFWQNSITGWVTIKVNFVGTKHLQFDIVSSKHPNFIVFMFQILILLWWVKNHCNHRFKNLFTCCWYPLSEQKNIERIKDIFIHKLIQKNLSFF